MPRETGGRDIADTGREIPSASDTGAGDPAEMYRMLRRQPETAEDVQGHAMLAVSLPDRETGPGNANYDGHDRLGGRDGHAGTEVTGRDVR